jgi:hypothetical protein
MTGSIQDPIVPTQVTWIMESYLKEIIVLHTLKPFMEKQFLQQLSVMENIKLTPKSRILILYGMQTMWTSGDNSRRIYTL